MSNNKFSNSFFEFVVMCLFACLLTYACVGCDEGTSMMIDQDMAMIVMDGGVDMADMGDDMDSDVDSDAGMEPDANVNEDMGVDMADMGPRECPAGTEDNGVACVDINDCDPNPCFPGVWCSDVPAPGVGFTCEECPAGTEGDGIVCTDADACDPNPCVNGGTCVENTSQMGFTCECTTSWSGTFCHYCPPGHEINGESCDLVPQPTPVHEFWPGYTGNIYYRWYPNTTGWQGFEGAQEFCHSRPGGGFVVFFDMYGEFSEMVSTIDDGSAALVFVDSSGEIASYGVFNSQTGVLVSDAHDLNDFNLDGTVCLVTSNASCTNLSSRCARSEFYTARNQADNNL